MSLPARIEAMGIMGKPTSHQRAMTRLLPSLPPSLGAMLQSRRSSRPPSSAQHANRLHRERRPPSFLTAVPTLAVGRCCLRLDRSFQKKMRSVADATAAATQRCVVVFRVQLQKKMMRAQTDSISDHQLRVVGPVVCLRTIEAMEAMRARPFHCSVFSVVQAVRAVIHFPLLMMGRIRIASTTTITWPTTKMVQENRRTEHNEKSTTNSAIGRQKKKNSLAVVILVALPSLPIEKERQNSFFCLSTAPLTSCDADRFRPHIVVTRVCCRPPCKGQQWEQQRQSDLHDEVATKRIPWDLHCQEVEHPVLPTLPH